MATDWAAEQLDAYNDIKDEGVAITIHQSSGGTYNPITDTTSGGTVTNYPTYAINTKFKDAYDPDVEMNRAWATTVKRGDRVLLVPGYGIPDIANGGSLNLYTLTYKGNLHNLVYSEAIEPGGVPILFRVAARR